MMKPYPSLPLHSGLCCDSRHVKPGNVFFALNGSKNNGLDYVGAAIHSGAAHIVVDQNAAGTDAAKLELLQSQFPHIGFTIVGNARAAFAFYAAQSYPVKPSFIAAVTGTNGKSSTVHFCREIWGLLGRPSASIGTMGIITQNQVFDFKLTTPDALMLHENLQNLAHQKIDHVAIEASSIGIDQHRLDFLPIRAAGFTNLTQDHLDYHGDMNAYRAAKLKLFSELLDPMGTAVVNADTPEFETIQTICRTRKIRCWGYGSRGADLKILSRRPLLTGQDVIVEIFGHLYEFSLPLIGEFQLCNMLCTIGIILSEERFKIEDILAVIPSISAVPGRLQKIPGTPDDRAVFVDYAHTPDGLETVLRNVRDHQSQQQISQQMQQISQQNGRILCVFGCGGDRDKTKRPIMGGIAARLSDHVYVTDDNPRSEDPATIRAEIIRGITGENFSNCPTRREAIYQAVTDLKPNDILIIAGKGHERGQIFADHVDDFDDSEVAHAAITEVFSP